jgi:hypothetical protein
LVILPLSFVHLENRICLSRGVQVIGAAWCATMRIMIGVGDLMQSIRDGRPGRVLGGRMIERSGGVVYVLHRDGFLVWASKLTMMVYQWFGLKTTGTVSPVWPQNRWRRFLG